MLRLAITSSVLLLGAAAASAQKFNIDLSTDLSTPSSAYGAASGQAGTWNGIPLDPFPGLMPVENVPLLDTGGGAGGVTLTLFCNDPSIFPFSYSNASAVNGIKTPAGSDHEALMDDLWCPDNGSGLSGVATVKGLAAGAYGVYVYASAPDSVTYFTDVTVNGSGPKSVGGEWPTPFAFADPITHTVFDNVTIAAGGELSIEFIWSIAPFASLNGFQIVPAGAKCKGDINGDGRVCQEDLGELLSAYGTCEGQPGYKPQANIAPTPVPACGNGQGIDQADLGTLLSEYGSCGDPCP